MDRDERHQQIVEAGSLSALLDRPDGRALLEEEASDPTLGDPQRLVTRDALDYLKKLRENRAKANVGLSLFGSEDVLIVPGFMGSALRDVAGPHGLIWIALSLLGGNGSQINALKLADFDADRPDHEAEAGVRIETPGAVPAIYDLLWADLNFRGYDPTIAPFDWRKDLERSAVLLADQIRNRAGQGSRPLHLIAHSQGTLVARRAVQLVGESTANRVLKNLVLLGPASFGTFASALALSGDHQSLATVQKFGVTLPPDFRSVFQSFTGLYQLLPWDKDKFDGAGVGFDPEAMKLVDFWQSGIQTDRLKHGFGWAEGIDASFFNDRTSIILGDQPTVGAVKFGADGVLRADGATVQGDGTVPDFLAKIPGVRRIYRASGVDHMTLPMHTTVMAAVRAILRGDTPALDSATAAFSPLAATARVRDDVPRLKAPAKVEPTGAGSLTTRIDVAKAAAPLPPRKPCDPPPPRPTPPGPPPRREPPTPPCRRLRVFSFDPVLGSHLETLEISRITIPIPWEPEGQLAEGPIGEYVEVIDYDPATGCFYQPVDLTHEKLTAQDGLAPNESDPQFHQQMCYAVAMATIATFEKALGRVALWAPRLVRDANDEVVPTPVESQYVPRLRIYPHALRDANAFYDPSRHSLLFGYFPSREAVGGETMPGGTVFACQSFDIIAHETTHALLHGLHDTFMDSSNPDVLAFHEAFADAVALFQHFSHPEVVRHEIARTRGDLKRGELLGNLALQFGQAMGKKRGALRQYINAPPDATRYTQEGDDPHDRGAVLMAALFRAFQNIYAERSKDLYQIAAGDLAQAPDRDLRPELVDRLAHEASTSARHVLGMCVRALDYVPPVDITFGEYLRALITADFDLVRDDDLGYRVAVIDAFRSWGIYPPDVNVLDEPALLWDSPDYWDRDSLREAIGQLELEDWKPRSDRRAAFLRINENTRKLRAWLFKNAREGREDGDSFGVKLFGTSCQSIPRNNRSPALPKFFLNSIRPCLRIGPDGEQRRDVVIEIVQRRAGFFDPAVQDQVDSATTPWAFNDEDREKQRPPLPTANQQPDFWFRGGSTLLVDPDSGEIRYCVRKSIRAIDRLTRQRTFEATQSASALYFGINHVNPLAMLHGDS